MHELELYKNLDLTKDYLELMKELDDNHNPRVLESMANKTYKVKIDGVERVIRLPGLGSKSFINYKNEKYLLNFINPRLTGKILYSDERGVQVSEFLSDNDGYHIYHKSDDYRIIAAILAGLHNSKYYGIKLVTDLLKDIRKYRSVIEKNDKNLFFLRNNLEYNKLIESFIFKNQHKNLAICHRDLMFTNILYNEKNLFDSRIINWEYAGRLNYLWDIGDFISEYELWFGDIDIIDFISWYEAYSGKHLDLKEVKYWIATVDYVWATWSLAKLSLGEEMYREYTQRRYNKFVKRMKELVED